ncbi:MAG: response regulator [Pyrinomonadaceae bacterium]
MRDRDRTTILYLDDDPGCLEVFAQTFGDEYEVRTAATAEQARRALAGCRFDVVISDQVMPRISGAAFLREVAQVYPEINRILLTGGAPVGAVVGEVASGVIHGFITKPWAGADIRRALERVRLRAPAALI